jgi:hypothetical protein
LHILGKSLHQKVLIKNKKMDRDSKITIFCS